MIPAVAFCPHPPLLVPAVMGDGAAARDDLRAACLDVVRAMLAAPAVEEVLMVGAGPGTGSDALRHAGEAWGTLGGYGVAAHAPTGHAAVEPTLPLSLTVGRWLLEEAGWSGPVRGMEVPPGLPPQRCAELGRRLAADSAGDGAAGSAGDGAAGSAGDRPTVPGLLLLADGSATRTPKAPGGLDPRAAAYDGAVAAALAAGDPDALARLDDRLSAAVGASGRAAWQVLAAAVAGRDVRARLVYDDAPYGVGYLVAHWALR